MEREGERERKSNREREKAEKRESEGKTSFTLQAKVAQIRSVNSTIHMESDIFNSDLGHFHMWT